MTLNAITKEIENRINQLNAKYYDIQNKISYCKMYGTDKEFNELISKRNRISMERSKLEDMLRAAKNF
ncbi:MAG: hypothetical protein IIX37_07465 [Selenomonadaceae bacterium]|nr:hypothetical protein [Selenomonadaceae bacterium]